MRESQLQNGNARVRNSAPKNEKKKKMGNNYIMVDESIDQSYVHVTNYVAIYLYLLIDITSKING